MITIDAVVAARDRIAGKIRRTPLMTASRLGERAGVSLSLKCESFQKTGSFKVRGALNAVMSLDGDQRQRGVITVSAGNHAQAVAYAATMAGVSSTVVMPASASAIKVEASRGYGATVVLHGANSIEAFAHARELQAQRGLVFVHPFDDEAVAAGAGTVGLELIDEDHAEPDVVVVPIGGGGLITGIAVALRARSPNTRIVGVEPTGAAVMRNSLDAGRPVRLEKIDTIADGLSAPMAGELTYPAVRDLVDDVVLVSDAEIAAAIRDLLTSAKLVAEPAAAASVAAVMTGRVGAQPGSSVVALVSGGNIDLTRLAEIAAKNL
jgi:threonine dehydratase